MMTLRPALTVAFAPLVAALGDARVVGSPVTGITSLAHDSRAIQAGGMFVALRGAHVDGHAYVDRAIRAGAVAIVVDEAFARGSAMPSGVTTIVVADTRRALSRLAAAFYNAPSLALRVAGVTGTNGKTTTTHIVAAMLGEAGVATGTIGTLGARVGGAMWSLDTTTPLALELHGLLGEMRDRGATAVAMEVSSHALALDRVADVTYAAAALTNVTRDHLDFHESFAAYAAAKRSLFARAPIAVLNADDACGARWANELRAAAASDVVTYGIDVQADLCARDVVVRADGSSFVVDGVALTTRLPGRFNIANALCAFALARVLGGNDAASVRALASFERVPGRMEHLGGGGIDVLVDYAHTPDALDVVLRAARETTRGALVAVFGCGGDRDRGKRPQMGRIATDVADRVIVTSDNPRSEDPQTIVDDIVRGVKSGGAVSIELDRRAAIRRAIADAAPGDVVVVAGKGHETYQIVGATTHHFDDRDEVRAALAAREDASR